MVEWKKLGELCNPLHKEIIKQGKLKENGKYPVVNSGITLYGYYDKYNNIGNAFTLASRGEYAGFVTYMSSNFWAGGLCYPYRSKNENVISTKFLYSYLKNIEEFIMNTLVMRGGIPALNKADVDKIKIPIPPPAKQTRIVGILDTFAASIDNLKEQIAQRRKQYEYYRDQLLDLEGKEGVEKKTLGEICDNLDYMRKPITSSKRKTGIYPYYGASGIVDYVEGYIFDGEYLLVSEDGANLVARNYPIAFSVKGKNWVNNHAHVLVFKSKITQKFVEIYLNMIDLSPWINGAAQPKLNQANLNIIDIPMPSLSEQRRIVSILDTFEASIQNLEAQLSQREKQYEYYRNKLLTFE